MLRSPHRGARPPARRVPQRRSGRPPARPAGAAVPIRATRAPRHARPRAGSAMDPGGKNWLGSAAAAGPILPGDPSINCQRRRACESSSVVRGRFAWLADSGLGLTPAIAAIQARSTVDPLHNPLGSVDMATVFSSSAPERFGSSRAEHGQPVTQWGRDSPSFWCPSRRLLFPTRRPVRKPQRLGPVCPALVHLLVSLCRRSWVQPASGSPAHASAGAGGRLPRGLPCSTASPPPL